MIGVHRIDAGFSADDCAALGAVAAITPARPGRLVGSPGPNAVRRAGLIWLTDLPGTDWVMDRLMVLVAQANRDTFGFDLTDFSESAQIARYDAADQGHFDWHSDIGDGPMARRRKLTLVAQLSPPEAYVGGALDIRPSGAILTADRRLGAVTVLPSYMLHRVTPVTTGSRLSLTVWAHGPGFR